LGYSALASWALNEQTLSAAALNAKGVDFALGALLSMKPNCNMIQSHHAIQHICSYFLRMYCACLFIALIN